MEAGPRRYGVRPHRIRPVANRHPILIFARELGGARFALEEHYQDPKVKELGAGRGAGCDIASMVRNAGGGLALGCRPTAV
jgi:hypothetical protein